MSRYQIACQTITWGPGQKEHYPEIFHQVASAKYTGVEIGFRHIEKIPPGELKSMLQKHKLNLVAVHMGGNLADTNQAEKERRMLQELLDYMKAAGTDILMYSGLRYEDDAKLERDLKALNRAAKQCREQGVRLLYHNHNWEFANDGKVIQALIKNDNPDLGFCPDIGWVMKGGMEIAELFEAIKGRIGAVHFKDFATGKPKTDTVLLGEGVAPLAEAAEWLRGNTEGMWIIAEQDRTSLSPDEATRRNAEYLFRLFG